MALKRLPLIAQAANRADSATIDARLINGVVEKDANGLMWSYKRPGMALHYASVGALEAIGQIPGPSSPVAFTTTSTLLTVAFPGGITQALSTLQFLGQASGPLTTGDTGTYFLYNQTPPSIGYESYLYRPQTGSLATSGGPSPGYYVPGVVNLDGTFYVMNSYGAIYGSNVKDPSTWNAANLIYTDYRAGPALYLGQQLAYVIAFQAYDIQMFYDAANATGSPLAPVQSSRITFGLAAVGSLVSLDEMYIFVAQGTSGERFVAQLENITAKPVSTPAIDRLLTTENGSGFTATAVRVMGHRFYILNLTNLNLRLAYDVDLQVWSEWDSTLFSNFVRGTFTYNNTTVFGGGTNLYTFDQSVGTDNGVAYAWELYSPPFDGGSRMLKYCPRMEFLTDNTPVKDLEVRWSDDDQQTWTNFRKVNLASSYPSLTGCGRFRRRTFHFRHTGAQPLRLQAVDLLLEEGTL